MVALYTGRVQRNNWMLRLQLASKLWPKRGPCSSGAAARQGMKRLDTPFAKVNTNPGTKMGNVCMGAFATMI